MTFCGIVISVVGMLYTLYNSVPVPAIFPIDNEARVYSGTAKVTINAVDLPFFHTYYSLDGNDPVNGDIYEGPLTIRKTTTVSAKNKFIFWWSGLSQRTYRFESVQNITVNNVDDEHTTIKDIFTYIIIILVFGTVFVLAVRGELDKE